MLEKIGSRMRITFGDAIEYTYLSSFADLSDIIEDEDVVLTVEPPTDTHPYCFKLEDISEVFRSLENVFENTEQYNHKENIFKSNDFGREAFLVHHHETLATCSYCGEAAQNNSLIVFNTVESNNRHTYIHVNCIPQIIEDVQNTMNTFGKNIIVRTL